MEHKSEQQWIGQVPCFTTPVFVQVVWPESGVAQPQPVAWDPVAMDAETTREGIESASTASRSSSDQLCMLLGAGAVGALALAVGAAWLYMGSQYPT